MRFFRDAQWKFNGKETVFLTKMLFTAFQHAKLISYFVCKVFCFGIFYVLAFWFNSIALFLFYGHCYLYSASIPQAVYISTHFSL